ncbi:MAG: ATP-binding cassette domain-containing protein [bacterium]
MSDIVLELKALTRRFGSFTAVDALTLSVNAGEVFGLLGSNGAGKTTTIKMLTTLLPPSSGEARVAGFSITTQAVGVRRAIGYVPQAVSVDGSLTGYENLLIFAKLYDLPHREQQGRIREALEFMGLTADGGRLVSQYSGGMVRRLEIAQSTLHRPRVLFLDEPTVGLDPIARDAVWKHLVDLRQEFHGPLIVANGFNRATATQVLAEDLADAVAFGRLFLVNPDLPQRFRLNAPLNAPDEPTFYGGGEKGYTDYPALGPQFVQR